MIISINRLSDMLHLLGSVADSIQNEQVSLCLRFILFFAPSNEGLVFRLNTALKE